MKEAGDGRLAAERLALGVEVSPQNQALSEFVWRTRYRDPQACPPELTILDTWRRVARSVAAKEPNPDFWAGRFLEILQSFRFLPGGRILAGAGVASQVTLFNCFVMGPIEDSVPGIFEALKEGALTMQQGGGVGYDFSTLRPRGSRTRTTGTIASGPVSFMRVWDAMCATILSTGTRRGAMMATLRCDHPDIEEFIDAKRSPEALHHFNLSVLVTDAFMSAVEQDAPWPLVFPRSATAETKDSGACEQRIWSGNPAPVACRVWKVVGARALWRKLCTSAQATAEPGVLFIDRINAENNLAYAECLSATNPCAEEPLPPYGACNLGSLNLPVFVRDPFSAHASLDLQALGATTRIAVRFLDDVIDVSRFPLSRQRIEAGRARRIGLGITGLADALLMLGLRYDSEPARLTASLLMRTVRDTAYRASIELAQERGAFEQFVADLYCERPFILRLPEELRESIRRNGIRNSHLLAVAPAGTISLLADNVSSGIEPIFRSQADRRVLDESGAQRYFGVMDHACALWQARGGARNSLPSAFSDQSSMAAREQLLMQAAVQPFVDGSISKTVTLQSGASADETREILELAYTLRLKGCTIFEQEARPGILSVEGTRSAAQDAVVPCCDIERESD